MWTLMKKECKQWAIAWAYGTFKVPPHNTFFFFYKRLNCGGGNFSKLFQTHRSALIHPIGRQSTICAYFWESWRFTGIYRKIFDLTDPVGWWSGLFVLTTCKFGLRPFLELSKITPSRNARYIREPDRAIHCHFGPILGCAPANLTKNFTKFFEIAGTMVFFFGKNRRECPRHDAINE